MDLRPLAVAGLITALHLFGSPHQAHAQSPDSDGLFGTWRWIHSSHGGLSLYPTTPASCGCERFLTLKPGGIYEYVERDSAHEYLLGGGAFTIHQAMEAAPLKGARPSPWLSFEHGLEGYMSPQIFWFHGPDTLLIADGAGYADVDGGSSGFVRDSGWTSWGRGHGTRLPLGDRPRRHVATWRADEESLYYDQPPVPVTLVQPVYPESARRVGIHGDVILRMRVGASGRVTDIRVVGGPGALRDAAVDAAKRWVFKPALSNDHPVEAWITMPVHFPP